MGQSKILQVMLARCLLLALCGGLPLGLGAQERAEVFVQLGHRSAVTAVAVSPDGRRVASASLDGSIKLWDLASGREIRSLEGHQGSVLAVAFSPDGRTLASGGRDRVVRVWDAASGALLRSFAGHDNIVLAVAFSPDGKALLSGGYDRSVRSWDLAKGVEAAALGTQTAQVRALAFARDGQSVAVALDDGTVRVLRYPAGNEIAALRGHRGGVLALGFSTAGVLASAGQDGTVRVWDVAAARETRQLSGQGSGQGGALTGVGFSADDKWLAASGQDGVLRMWRAADGQPVRQLRGHAGDILGIAFSPRGGVMVSGGQDRAVHIWNIENGGEQEPLRNRTGDVRAIAQGGQGGRYVAVAGGDGVVRVWEAATGKVARVLGVHRGSVDALAFSPDARLLASAGQDRVIRLWDWSRGVVLREFPGHQGTVQALAFAPDGRQLASGGLDAVIRIWDVAGGAEPRELAGHKMSVRGLAYSPDGRLLASASYDDSVRLWNPGAGTLLRSFTDHANRVTSVAFSADGKWLASGSEDSTVRLRSPAGGDAVREFSGHTAPVRAVVFGSDSRMLASAGIDGRLIRWDVNTGKPLAATALGAGQLLAIAAGPEAGGSFAAGGDGGATVVVSASEGRERARLFGFSGGEWVSITPEGFFNTSDGGARYLNVRIGAEVHGLEQFTETFFRPDLVQIALAGSQAQAQPREDGAAVAAVAAAADERRRAEAQRQREQAAERAREEADRLAREEAQRREQVARLERERAVAQERNRAEAARVQAEAERRRQEVARLEAARQAQDEARRGSELARLEAERVAAEQKQREDAERARQDEARRRQELAQLEAARLDAERRVEEARRRETAAREERERADAERQRLAAPGPAPRLTASRRLDQVRPAPRVSVADTPAEVAQDQVTITLRIEDAGGGVGDVRLYLNGTAVRHDTSRSEPGAATAGGLRRYTIRLVRGKNALRAVAFNADNSMQSADALHEVAANFSSSRRPSVHALVVGIQEFVNPRLALRYSIADARLFAQVISERAGGLFETVNMKMLLTPAETTREALTAAFTDMRGSVGPEDLFVFYAASHGTVDEGEYFLFTSNVGSTATARLRSDAIGQAALREMIANIPATKKFVVIDTCNAGQLGDSMQVAVLARGLNEDRATKLLSRAVGSTVLMASTSQQEALEGYKEHGLFTWVVVEGLRGKADADKDGFVKTGELADYVDNEVPELAEQLFRHKQFPTQAQNGQAFPLVRSAP